MRVPRSPVATLVVALVLSAAADAPAGPIVKLSLDPEAEVVDVFGGIERGLFEVNVKPRNEFEAGVFIRNLSDRPLTVSLPPAVAAVQALKQIPGFGNPFQFQGGSNTGLGLTGGGNQQGFGQAQSVGGQLAPGGGNSIFNNQFPNAIGNQFPQGNNFFSIPPEKTVRLELHSVCAEHGRREPVPGMRYELRKLEDVVANSATRALISGADFKAVDRQALQAAVWYLENGMSWEELAAKSLTAAGVRRSYFTRSQLESARRLTVAARAAEEKNPTSVATTTPDATPR